MIFLAIQKKNYSPLNLSEEVNYDDQYVEATDQFFEAENLEEAYEMCQRDHEWFPFQECALSEGFRSMSVGDMFIVNSGVKHDMDYTYHMICKTGFRQLLKSEEHVVFRHTEHR